MADTGFETIFLVGIVIFYAIVIFLLGSFGIAHAEAQGLEDVNIFTGVYSLMTSSPINENTQIDYFFYFLVFLPIGLALGFMTANIIRGR